MYQYLGCGLSNVFLESGYETVKTRYGVGVVIHNLPGLHAAIAGAIVANPSPMVGAEFRFLRQELELSQAALAGLLGRDEQTLARWEKGKVTMDPLADRLMRCLYQECLPGKKLKPMLELLKRLESVPPQTNKFVAGEKGSKWGVEAKCA